MDESARRADIGKDTIYLSWDTKDDLIRTLVIQEIIGVCQGISRITVLHSPVARLSELSRELFTLAFKYPLFRALYTYDKETLGRARDDPQLGFQCYRFTTFTPFRDYLRMLHESRTRPTVSRSTPCFPVSSNFICTPRSPEARPGLAAHPDSLASLISSSFESADQVPIGELTDPRPPHRRDLPRRRREISGETHSPAPGRLRLARKSVSSRAGGSEPRPRSRVRSVRRGLVRRMVAG
ncbi:AcrR family transcriptional regulator [Nonomuraea angiospora]|uniref:AcrR family transcriptional regulator n=2 Tax=Nonomuraea angiospora TaxID=46172 RepID=A0ABR9MAI6_9ACTN|nr:AcrR family transcriptional regulator [Nonomuraea angiospora]